MKPLASILRPKSLKDIIGQDHLVGKNGVISKMIEKDKLFSMILYGPSGTGKTSIANVISEYYSLNTYTLNAGTDNKAMLQEIISKAKHYDNTILIIDEIHRMKKDIQDYLLPFLEDGSITLIGLTTNNPYMSINPAIRSRLHIYKLNEISKIDIKSLLIKIINDNPEFKKLEISLEVIDFITSSSGLEIRTAINMLESITLLDKPDINISNVEKILGAKALRLDGGGEYYYDLLSAFIKSIRGSNVDAAILYLARLITIGDLEMIARRLMIAAFEEVSLANPSIIPRIISACDAALKIGMPEAKIPLAYATIDLALSPKSNSCYLAINKALDYIKNNDNFSIPKNILNKEIKGDSSLYKYPHDYPNGYVEQQYMPNGMENVMYYIPKTNSKYEKLMNEYLNEIKKQSIK